MQRVSSILFLPVLIGCDSLSGALGSSSFFGGSQNDEYLAWLETVSYDQSAFLPSSNDDSVGVALHWTVTDTHIELAVAAKATGWVAFGLGEAGGMLGADIVMYEAERNKLVDSYVLGESVTPFPDDCQSWTLVDRSIGRDFIAFQATRLLDSGDTQDRIFINDSDPLIPAARVIAAWGDSSEPSYHGGSVARSAIRFFGHRGESSDVMSFEARMASEAQGNFTLLAKNYTIPTNRSTFENFCLSRDEILAQGVPLGQSLHLIGFEPIIDPRSKRNVHHFTVLGSTSMDCSEETMLTADGLYMWAPGVQPMDLPSNVGSPMGLSSIQTFFLEFHYDNPTGEANIVDNSGIRLFYTNKKREFDLGIFQTGGDPTPFPTSGNVIDFKPLLVSATPGLSQHVFDCLDGCVAKNLTRPVTVIKQYFHMHWTGVSSSTMQIRDGDVIRESGVQFWDFAQQGDYAAPQSPFEVLPGDTFRTVCNYNALNNETWGPNSNDEMCQVYFYYYPRQAQDKTEGLGLEFVNETNFFEFVNETNLDLLDYGMNYTLTQDFHTIEQLGRTFGLAPATCVEAPVFGDPESSISSASISFMKTSLILGTVGGVVTQMLL